MRWLHFSCRRKIQSKPHLDRTTQLKFQAAWNQHEFFSFFSAMEAFWCLMSFKHSAMSFKHCSAKSPQCCPAASSKEDKIKPQTQSNYIVGLWEVAGATVDHRAWAFERNNKKVSGSRVVKKLCQVCFAEILATESKHHRSRIVTPHNNEV